MLGGTTDSGISFLDVLRFFFQKKYFLLVGSLLGAVLAYACVILTGSSYHSALFVSLDVSGFPAQTKPDLVVETFNNSLQLPQVSVAAADAIINSDLAFKETLKKRGITLADLSLGRMQRSEHIVALKKSETDLSYLAELSLPVSGLGAAAGSALIAGLNAVSAEYNKTVASVEEQLAEIRVQIQEKKVNDLQAHYIVEREHHDSVVDQDMIKLTQLEYSIRQKLKGHPQVDMGEGKQVISTETPPGLNSKVDGYFEFLPSVVQNAFGHDINQEYQQSVNRIVRLLGIAKSLGLTNNEEIQRVNKELSPIVLNITKANIDFSRASYIMRMASQSYLTAVQQQVTGLDRSTKFLPMFHLDQNYFNAVLDSRALEKRRYSSKPLAIVFGALVGLSLTIALMLMIGFFVKHKKYLLEE